MHPAEHFDKPGKSPFMDMQLIPKYARDAAPGSIAVDSRVVQNLGLRLAKVEQGSFATRGRYRPALWPSMSTASKPYKCANQDGSSDSTYVRP